MSGEYDYSGLAELGEAAHQAIPGSTFTLMQGVGHFPMSENPRAFIEYLLPILDQISA
ncbi:MAG: alpha/beta fold hydrolase [Pseudomonadales bacterium]